MFGVDHQQSQQLFVFKPCVYCQEADRHAQRFSSTGRPDSVTSHVSATVVLTLIYNQSNSYRNSHSFPKENNILATKVVVQNNVVSCGAG